MGAGAGQQYAAVHAQVRALYSTLLTNETWATLCEAPNFSSLLGLLKETVYGSYLSEVEERLLTPRRVIYQANKHLAEAFQAILYLLPDAGRQLITQLYRRYEVDNLKALLRGIETGTPWDSVRYFLFPFGPFGLLPAQHIAESASVTAAVELLHETPYYDILNHAMKRYTSEQSLFPLEVALDLEYWRELWQDVNYLPNIYRTQLQCCVGTLLDVTNLMWAIRYRVNHNLSEEEIINYTLPFGYLVNDEDIRAIAAGMDIAHILERIYPELEGVAGMLKEPRMGLPQLETQLLRHIVATSRDAFLGYPFHIGVPVAYLLLAELEMQDLTVLVEAKATHTPPEAFRPFMLTACCGTA
ncbi:MAG: V-type ATPase subunit [Anaerolineae bacterium]|nr:V-type ATPase subunit [Anaerolineae bacterium]